MPENTTNRAALRTLEIENFRGIERLSLDLRGPDGRATAIVVLAGPNGSGKTTALEACLIGALHGDLLHDFDRGRAIRFGASDFRITACVETSKGLVWGEHRSAEQNLWKDMVTAPAARLTDPVDVPCAYFSSWRAPKLVGPVPITAGRRSKRLAATEENRLWIVKQSLVNAKAHDALTGSRLPLAPEETPKPSFYRSLIGQLDEIWEMFHPGSGQHFSVEPVGDDPDEGFDVFLVGPGSQRVPLDGLSSGELELFNFVGWMLAVGFEGGIICIDEPELHLDPQWHALILRALRKLQPNSQFVVATHSPRIYDSVLSFERHFLVSPDDPRAKAWGIQDLAKRTA